MSNEKWVFCQSEKFSTLEKWAKLQRFSYLRWLRAENVKSRHVTCSGAYRGNRHAHTHTHMQYAHSIKHLLLHHPSLCFMKFRCAVATVCGSKIRQRAPLFGGRFTSLNSRVTSSLCFSWLAHQSDRLPFERLHTVPRRFHLNATASVDVAMMFRDDTSEVMMLYDTNCSATVVRLAQSERLATLLLLPKAELQPLEECLSDGRMSFWLSNLKPG